MRTVPKGADKVMDLALKNGFVLVRSRKHLVFKRGNLTFVMSASPSCAYAARNAMSDLTRLLKKGYV